MRTERCCGVLLHPTSLPGPDGVGTLGDDARRFVDLICAMGMSLWQVLPLTPPACGNSPYSSFSAFAGNPLLIDLDQVAREGDIPFREHYRRIPPEHADFSGIAESKPAVLRSAAATFLATERTPRKEEFWHFCNTTPWLHDYALFMALKQKYRGKPWIKWPRDAALLTSGVYEKASVELGVEIGAQKYMQWQFFRQWGALKVYAAERGVELMGDLPIFVAYDSVDVWRNRRLFLLDEAGKPTAVAGVPPDYFSSTGQLWGNPLYDWNAMEQDGFGWWVERFRHLFRMYDRVRVDHFRGFEAAWHVPAGHRTAMQGSWVPGPAESLFDAVSAAVGDLPIIAEDLGVITPQVERLRDRYGFPGMKILQFAFGSGPGNPYLPHNHLRNCVVYTGTHDNDTTAGWAETLDAEVRSDACAYLGCSGGELPDRMIGAAFMSVADTAVVPFQDLLGLPGTCRMNVPGTALGNWGWRFCWQELPRSLAAETRCRLERYGRNRRRP